MTTSRHIGMRLGVIPLADENANTVLMNGKQLSSFDIGKTPIRTKSRRALGDISNRKRDQGGILDGKSGNQHKTTTTTKPVSNVSLSRKSSSLQISNAHAALGVNSRSAALKSASNRRVEFSFPIEQSKSSVKQDFSVEDSTEAINDTSARTNASLDDSIDIIQPAGRTWDQQIANGDHDEEPDDISLEGAETIFDDYIKIMRKDHDHRMHKLRKEDEECSNYIDRLLLDWVKSCCDEGKITSSLPIISKEAKISAHT
jgi:hypothetical protein